ncbi:MAG TPA: PHB depolymerase family esterase [Fimbriimonas sp.]
MAPSLSTLAALLVVGCAPQTIVPTSYPDVAPGRYSKTLESGGLTRSYVLRVPEGYDRSKPTPLVLTLHGYTGSASVAEKGFGVAEAAEKEGWISVFPNGAGDPRGWNAGFINLTGTQVNDVAFIGKLLDQLEKDLHVDRKRVYVAGHSNGAMMAHLIGSRLSNRIAAVGAVAGIAGLSAKTMISAPDDPVSVIMVHGKRDPLVGYDASASALLRGLAVPAGAKWWANTVGASRDPIVTRADWGTVETWTGGREGSEVRLVTIEQGQHEWPRNKVDATALLFEFFKSHPKRG